MKWFRTSLDNNVRKNCLSYERYPSLSPRVDLHIISHQTSNRAVKFAQHGCVSRQSRGACCSRPVGGFEAVPQQNAC